MQTLMIGGHSLETCWFTVEDTDEQTVIVLLHEGLGCVSLWRDFPKLLAEQTGLRVFAYSRAGYGGSTSVSLPRPLDYMSLEATDTLSKVLDAIDSSAVLLVGHSDGASISAIHAANAHASVKGLVLIAPHFFVETVTLEAIRATRTAYLRQGLREKLTKYHAAVDVAFYGWSETWLHPDFTHWNIEAYLPRVTVPVLAIQGRDDPYASFRQIDALCRGLPTPPEILALDDCHHAPHLEYPHPCVERIASFATRIVGH